MRGLVLFARHRADVDEIGAALRRTGRALERGGRAIAFGARLPDRLLRGVGGSARFRARASVEERRVSRRQPGDHAAADVIARLDIDALQAPGHRRRDHESIADARLTVFVDRDLHRTARDRRDVDVDRARPERDRRDDPNRGNTK